MTQRKSDPVLHPDDDDGEVEPTQLDHRHNKLRARRFDLNAAASLNAIAKQLGVPVERFYGAPGSFGSGTVLGEIDASEQERRLLSALRRTTDPYIRQTLVELAETLASEL